MSDPVSNHDIEDVLSSIRRLVAQGDPKSTAQAAPEPMVTPDFSSENSAKSNTSDDRRGAGRLVLTPAFRVADPVDADGDADASGSQKPFDAAMREPESDVIPTKDARPIPAPAASPSERASLEATIAELEAAVNSRDGEFEPDGSEVQAETSLPSAFLHKLDAVKLRPRIVDDAEDDVEIDPQDEADGTEDSAESAVAAAVTDHISEAVASQIADAFPRWNAANEGPQAEEADQDVEIDEVAAAPEEAVVIEMPREAEPAPEAVAVDEAPVDDVEAVEPASEPEMLYKPYVAPTEIDETIIAPTFRHTSFSEVYDPVAEATADAAEAAPDAGDIYGDELAPDPEQPQTAVATPQATPLMDPDMLRDMVGQMIREELQGEMGERITRNVRKLVRREINRVISSQDFQ